MGLSLMVSGCVFAALEQGSETAWKCEKSLYVSIKLDIG